MSNLEAIILGIIQGLTEFLPVSSSGHIELGKALLNVQVNDPLLFSIVVHGATALSTVVIFWRTIWELIRDALKLQWNASLQYMVKIGISMMPAGLVGVFLEDQIDTFFEGRIVLVGCMLVLTGVLLYLTTRAKHTNGEVTFAKSLWLGIVQAIAIMPGISRSGATISTALLLGIDRERAARFSFLMVVPLILGAMLVKVKKYMDADEAIANSTAEALGTMPLVLGFLAAFLSGLLACTWMINLVKRGKLVWFAAYCALVGVIAIVMG